MNLQKTFYKTIFCTLFALTSTIFGVTTKERDAYTKLTNQIERLEGTSFGGRYMASQIKKQIKEIDRHTKSLKIATTDLQRFEIATKVYKIFFNLKAKYFYRKVTKKIKSFRNIFDKESKDIISNSNWAKDFIFNKINDMKMAKNVKTLNNELDMASNLSKKLLDKKIIKNIAEKVYKTYLQKAEEFFTKTVENIDKLKKIKNSKTINKEQKETFETLKEKDFNLDKVIDLIVEKTIVNKYKNIQNKFKKTVKETELKINEKKLLKEFKETLFIFNLETEKQEKKLKEMSFADLLKNYKKILKDLLKTLNTTGKKYTKIKSILSPSQINEFEIAQKQYQKINNAFKNSIAIFNNVIKNINNAASLKELDTIAAKEFIKVNAIKALSYNQQVDLQNKVTETRSKKLIMLLKAEKETIDEINQLLEDMDKSTDLNKIKTMGTQATDKIKTIYREVNLKNKLQKLINSTLYKKRIELSQDEKWLQDEFNEFIILINKKTLKDKLPLDSLVNSAEILNNSLKKLNINKTQILNTATIAVMKRIKKEKELAEKALKAKQKALKANRDLVI